MSIPKKHFAIFIGCLLQLLPGLVSSTPSFRCRSLIPWSKHFPQLTTVTPNNVHAPIRRKPWAIERGGAIDGNSTIDENDTNDENDEETAQCIFRASKAGDGSESDPDGIPDRFLRMQKGNRPKAKAAFDETVRWRGENGVDRILSLPHTKFDLCRAVFPVYIPGRDVAGNLIIVQRPGYFDVDALLKNNATSDDVLMHYIYVVEYCWNVLEPGPPDRTMTVILDLERLSFSTFRNTEKRNFMLKFVKTMSDNYPQRSYKTLIINAPTWFDVMYKVVKPMLRASTRKKIHIIKNGQQQDTTLIEVLGIDSVPREILYNQTLVEGRAEMEGGCEPGANSLIEKELRLFCTERIKKSNASMELVV